MSDIKVWGLRAEEVEALLPGDVIESKYSGKRVFVKVDSEGRIWHHDPSAERTHHKSHTPAADLRLVERAPPAASGALVRYESYEPIYKSVWTPIRGDDSASWSHDPKPEKQERPWGISLDDARLLTVGDQIEIQAGFGKTELRRVAPSTIASHEGQFLSRLGVKDTIWHVSDPGSDTQYPGCWNTHLDSVRIPASVAMGVYDSLRSLQATFNKIAGLPQEQESEAPWGGITQEQWDALKPGDEVEFQSFLGREPKALRGRIGHRSGNHIFAERTDGEPGSFGTDMRDRVRLSPATAARIEHAKYPAVHADAVVLMGRSNWLFPLDGTEVVRCLGCSRLDFAGDIIHDGDCPQRPNTLTEWRSEKEVKAARARTPAFPLLQDVTVAFGSTSLTLPSASMADTSEYIRKRRRNQDDDWRADREAFHALPDKEKRLMAMSFGDCPGCDDGCNSCTPF